jgi:HEPN domain-containing protein
MAFYRKIELQSISQAKIDDARLLLENGRSSNAYYLAGYAVEIGLKACIAKQISAAVLPDKRFINDTYVHDLRKLVGVAGLSHELSTKEENDINFATNWAIVAQWTPEKRYEGIDQYTAQILVEAIAQEGSGVLPWIRTFW